MNNFFKIIMLLILPLLSLASPPSSPVANIWQPAAQQVCDQINQAVHFYEKNDVKKAHLTAVMAYFKGYDAEIEPAVRITLGGPHVFEMERKFRDLSTLMTPNPDKKQFKIVNDAAIALCQLVKKDADALNANHVQRQVFKVE